MMTLAEVLQILQALSIICGIIFLFVNFRHGQKSDDSASAREIGVMLSEIGYVKSQNETLLRKLESTDTRYMQLVERVAAVETSDRNAHNRIDTIMKKIVGEK